MPSHLKLRICLFLVLATLWTVLSSILRPAGTLVRQHLAVDALSSSNSAYIAQQAVEQGAPWGLINVGVVFLIAFACVFLFRSSKTSA